MIRGTMILLTTVSTSFTPQDDSDEDDQSEPFIPQYALDDKRQSTPVNPQYESSISQPSTLVNPQYDPYESQPSTSTYPYSTTYEDDQSEPFIPQYALHDNNPSTLHPSYQLSTSAKGKGKGKGKGKNKDKEEDMGKRNWKKDLCNRYNDETVKLNNAMDDCQLSKETLEFILQKRDEMHDQYKYYTGTHNSNLYGSNNTGVDNQRDYTYGNNNFSIPSTCGIKEETKYPYVKKEYKYETTDVNAPSTSGINMKIKQESEHHCVGKELELPPPVNEPQHLEPNPHVIVENEILTVNQIREEIIALEEMKTTIVEVNTHTKPYDARTITGIRNKLYMNEIVESCCAYALSKGNLLRDNVSRFRVTMQEFTCFDPRDEILELGNFTSWAEIIEKYNKTSDLKECCDNLYYPRQELIIRISTYIADLSNYIDAEVRPRRHFYLNQHNGKKQQFLKEIDAFNRSAAGIKPKIDLISIVRRYITEKLKYHKVAAKNFGKEVRNFINIVLNELRQNNLGNVDKAMIVNEIKGRLSGEARRFYDDYCG